MLFASLQDRMELGTMEGRRAREDGGYRQKDMAAATWWWDGEGSSQVDPFRACLPWALCLQGLMLA